MAAGARRSWTLLLAALLLGAGTIAVGQSAERGSLSGSLTDLHSSPLGGVALIVRNQATGAEMRATTAKNGSYRFSGLDAGEYTLEAVSPELGQGRLEAIEVIAGREARVQAAMEFEPLPVAQPVQVVFHSIVPQAPVLTGTLAMEPLRQLALSGQSLPESAREMPATVVLALSVRVPAEEMQTLALAGWPRQDSVREAAAVASPADGQKGSVLAVSGTAADTVQTALQSAQPNEKRECRFNKTQDACEIRAFPPIAKSAMDGAPSFIPPEGLQSRGPVTGNRPIQAELQNAETVAQAVTGKVTAEQLQAVPLSGRRWQDFVLDTSQAPAGAAGSGSMSGGGSQAAETTVDGASKRSAFGSPNSAGQNGMGQAWAGGRGFALGEAAVREVQTAAGNVEAQAARAAGGHMNVETERGVNGLHGQGFYFDRQNTWGAKNPFTQWVKETAPATLTVSPVFTAEAYTPPDHESTWGIGVGSQIRRNKLFWFAALDAYQRNDPGLATVRHPDKFFAQPSNEQMQVLSARLGLSSSNPVAAGLAAYSKMLETLDGLLGPAVRTATQWTGFARIDWEPAERHRLTLEAIGARWNSPGGGLTRVSETNGSNSFGSSEASEEWLLGRWEAFVTPNLLAVTQGSAGRSILSSHADTPSAYEQTFLKPNVWGQLPQMIVDSRYGFTIGNPARFGKGSYPDERLYQAQESLDWVHGGLLVKAGFDLRHDTDSTSLLRNQTGTYYYANVENFASDALAFAAYGVTGQLDPYNQHNCDQTGKVWRDSTGTLHGLGYLPCYSYYSQSMGPTDWWLSTNDWAGYATVQWQPKKLLVFSAGLRWEREQMPPPIARVNNPELPLTEKLPSLGNNWGPRLSLALGNKEAHWPVLRLGYGMYFGRVQNAVIETALTQTGSAKGDLNFFMRPTDNLKAGGAPPFPYVFAGEPLSMVKPGAVEFAPRFRNSEVHQGEVAVEETLPGHVQVTASAMVSLGRRLPISIDTNFDPAVNPGTITYAVVDGTGKGPIKSEQLKVPFYASWPSATSGTGTAGRLNASYQQITEIESRANSTYEAAMLRVSRYARRGLSLHARYTYAHAMDWNPNESTAVTGSDVLDPANFGQEYGTSNLDVRHSASATVILEAPWKLHNRAGRLLNGWVLSGVGYYRSGMPYTMRTSGSLAKEFTTTGTLIAALGPGMNGSGGDNRVYGVGRNTFRYPSAWKADVRLGKRFDLGHMRQLEFLAESFNLFNHQNVTQLETIGYYIEPGSLTGGMPTLNFMTGLKANSTAFGQPLNINATNFYRERQVQVGVRLRF